MKRFMKANAEPRARYFLSCFDDYIADTNPVRVVDVFVDELDLGKLGFEGRRTGGHRTLSYHPPVF